MCESDSELHILVKSQKQISFSFDLFVLNQTRRWYSGRLFDGLFDSSVVQLGFMENSKKRRLLLSGAATSAHLSARLWTQASKPALTDSSLAMKIPV